MFYACGWIVLLSGAGRAVTRAVDREVHCAAREIGMNHAVSIWNTLRGLSGRLLMSLHSARSVVVDLSGFFCSGGLIWACEMILLGVLRLIVRAIHEWERKDSEEGTSQTGESSGWCRSLADGLWG